MGNEQFNNFEKPAEGRGESGAGEALLKASQEGQKAGDGGAAVSKGFADGSYKAETEDLAKKMENPQQYMEDLRKMSPEQLQQMLDKNEAAIKSYQSYIGSADKKLSTAMKNL